MKKSEEIKNKISKAKRSLASSSTSKEFIPHIEFQLETLRAEYIHMLKVESEEATQERKAAKGKSKEAVKNLVKRENEAKEEVKRAQKMVKEAQIDELKARKQKNAKSIEEKGKELKTRQTIQKKKLKGLKRSNYTPVAVESKKFNKGRSASDIKRDKKRTALAPGMRTSASGERYGEYRSNRADISPRLKLEEGGSSGY